MFEFNATFLIAMLSFVVFIIIMNAIFYKPILGIISERESFINKNYFYAQKCKNDVQCLLDDKEKRLNDTLIESKKIVSDKLNDANDKAQIITNNAKSESAIKIQNAKEKLLKTQQQTAESLNDKFEELADIISSKIIGKD